MNKTLYQFMLLAFAVGMTACSQHQHGAQESEKVPAVMDAMSVETPATSTPAEISDRNHTHPAPSEEQSDASENHPHHPHAALEIPAGEPIPTVELIVHDDAVQGWNLELQLTNFRFAPENVNQTSQFNEGHAHLYVDGEKVARLYGPWYYLATLSPGEHTLMVTLNANGHEELQINGQTVTDTVTLTVPEL